MNYFFFGFTLFAIYILMDELPQLKPQVSIYAKQQVTPPKNNM